MKDERLVERVVKLEQDYKHQRQSITKIKETLYSPAGLLSQMRDVVVELKGISVTLKAAENNKSNLMSYVMALISIGSLAVAIVVATK